MFKKMHWLVLSVLPLIASNVQAQISPNHYYGSGIQMNGIANIRVSPVGHPMVSYRFRVPPSGTLQTRQLQSVWPYLINFIDPDDPPGGYALGSGGTLRLEVREDDGTLNHFPSTTVLGSAEYPDALESDNSQIFHAFNFSPSVNLTVGKIYHLVWSNTDPNPSSNYVSVQFAYYEPGQAPAQPTMRPEDFAALAFNGTAWLEMVPPNKTGSFIPVVNMIYSDGAQGQSYYQNAQRHVIGGTLGSSAAQQVIDVTGSNRTVVRISVRARLISGTAPLRIQVRDAFGGTINNCLVPSSQFVPNEDTYVTCAFTSAYTLLSGQRYFVTLQATAGTTYDTLGVTNHAETNPQFGEETSFPDGHAEYKIDGGAWTQWDGPNGPGPWFDLQFYFTLR